MSYLGTTAVEGSSSSSSSLSGDSSPGGFRISSNLNGELNDTNSRAHRHHQQRHTITTPAEAAAASMPVLSADVVSSMTPTNRFKHTVATIRQLRGNHAEPARETQKRDLLIFERHLKNTYLQLQSVKRRYEVFMIIMILVTVALVSNAFFRWKAYYYNNNNNNNNNNNDDDNNSAMTSSTPVVSTNIDGSFFTTAILPIVLCCSIIFLLLVTGTYKNKISEPDLYLWRINQSLRPLSIAFDAKHLQLVKVTKARPKSTTPSPSPSSSSYARTPPAAHHHSRAGVGGGGGGIVNRVDTAAQSPLIRRLVPGSETATTTPSPYRHAGLQSPKAGLTAARHNSNNTPSTPIITRLSNFSTASSTYSAVFSSSSPSSYDSSNSNQQQRQQEQESDRFYTSPPPPPTPPPPPPSSSSSESESSSSSDSFLSSTSNDEGEDDSSGGTSRF